MEGRCEVCGEMRPLEYGDQSIDAQDAGGKPCNGSLRLNDPLRALLVPHGASEPTWNPQERFGMLTPDEREALVYLACEQGDPIKTEESAELLADALNELRKRVLELRGPVAAFSQQRRSTS